MGAACGPRWQGGVALLRIWSACCSFALGLWLDGKDLEAIAAAVNVAAAKTLRQQRRARWPHEGTDPTRLGLHQARAIALARPTLLPSGLLWASSPACRTQVPAFPFSVVNLAGAGAGGNVAPRFVDLESNRSAPPGLAQVHRPACAAAARWLSRFQRPGLERLFRLDLGGDCSRWRPLISAPSPWGQAASGVLPMPKNAGACCART